MITPRWAGVVFAIVGTLGMALMAWTDSFWIAVLGAGLFAGSLLLLILSMWRVAIAHRRATLQRLTSFGASLDEFAQSVRAANSSLQHITRFVHANNTSVKAANNSIKYLTKAAQTTINKLETHPPQFRALQAQNTTTSDRLDAFAEGILADIAQLQLDVGDYDAAQSQLGAELLRGLRLAERDHDQVVAQLHGIVALYSVFQPERPYPDFGSRSIEADLAKHYVERIMRDRPSVVIEVGSGLSTLLSAKALEEIGSEGHVFALEHERDWAEITKATLEEHGLGHRATILHAPLTEVRMESEVWKWYYLNNVDLPTGAQLLLVDGPPQSTGSPARYPALPVLIDHLTDDAVILLVDGIRQDEIGVVERWVAEIPGLNVVRHADRKETIEIRRIDE